MLMLVYALAQKGVYSNQWSWSAYGSSQKPTGAAALGLSPAQYNRAAQQYAQGGSSAGARYVQGGGSPALAEYFAKFM